MIKRVRILKRSVLVALVALLATLLFHNMINASQADRVRSMVAMFSTVFTSKLEEQVRTRLGIAQIIQMELESGRLETLEDFTALATAVHDQFRDLQALNWVNAEGIIEAVTPLNGNEPALGLNVAALEIPGTVLREARESGEMRITPPISLAQGGTGFVAYVPVKRDSSILGFLNIVFRAEPLIDQAMDNDAEGSFRISVSDGSKRLYGQDGKISGSEFYVASEIQVGGRVWRVLVEPTRMQIEIAETRLDEIVLAAGLFLSLLLAFLFNHAAHQKQTLISSEERFGLAMKGANDGLFDWEPETGKTYFSPRWFQMLGYAPDDLPSRYGTFLKLLHPEDREAISSYPFEDVAGKGGALESEFRMRHKDGSWVNILARAFVVRKSGKVARIVGTHVDITELRNQQAELERAAATDDLTGLRNRRGLSKDLSLEIQRLNEDSRLAILHIDLDMFKTINDTYGHDIGDFVLQQKADVLRSQGTGASVIARVGGDEFLLAIRTGLEDSKVVDLGTRLIKAISEPVNYKGRSCRVGASIGVAFAEKSMSAPMEETISNADIALNTAKTLGRGRCVVFCQQMRHDAVNTAELASQIREGLERDEFRPFFQPQVDIKTMEIIGFEALARWDHPTRGILGASTFVAVAESTHVIKSVDDRILLEICKAIPRLAGSGLVAPKVSINLSTAQLSDPNLVEKLIWTMDSTNVPAHSIRIEILETTLLSDRTANVVKNVHALADAGFAIELDDFGTGHTAIASLLNFPVERIKIDRSLVSRIDKDQNLQAITEAIINLGQKLGIRVLAEGIETKEEFDFLASTSCTCAQGYYIARPMPLEDLLLWIADWRSGGHELERFRA